MDDQDPEDRKFDFDTMMREARIGYAELSSRRKELRESIEKLLAEEALVVAQSEKLGKMLSAMGVEPEESLSRPRQRGDLMALSLKVIEDLFRASPTTLGFSEDEIVSRVKAQAPFVHERSIHNALLRLAQQRPGKVSRTGNSRSTYAYTFSDVDVTVAAWTPKTPALEWIDPNLRFEDKPAEAIDAASPES